MKMNKKGFTIVELVIVIAVIAILAGVMIPTFGGVIESANRSAAQQEAKSVRDALIAADATKYAGADICVKIVKGSDEFYFSTVDGVTEEVDEAPETGEGKYTELAEKTAVGTGSTAYTIPEGITVYYK